MSQTLLQRLQFLAFSNLGSLRRCQVYLSWVLEGDERAVVDAIIERRMEKVRNDYKNQKAAILSSRP